MIEKSRPRTAALLLGGALLLLAPASIAAPPRPSGNLDAGWGGGDGVTLTRIAGQFAQDAAGAARMPDGRIVVAGGSATSATADSRFILVAYDPSGRADSTFGTGGRVTTHFTGSGGERANAVVRDSGGGIVVAGQVDGDPGAPVQDQFGIVRYDEKGKVDPGFGTGGGLRIGFFAGRSAQPTAILEQPDRKLVVAGRTTTAAGTRFALTRLLPDGKGRDPAFGVDGRVTTALTPEADFESVFAAALTPDGRVVVAGEAGGQLAIVRYSAAGQLDPSFDGDGLKLLRFSDRGQNALALRATGVAVEPNGRVVAAGDATFSFFDRRYVTVRLKPTGELDPAWNGSGLSLVGFTTLVADRRALGAANTLIRSGDGKYLVGGDVDLDPDRQGDTRQRRRFALVRLTASGRLDRTFGGDGRVITQLASADESVAALVRQPDGLVVAAGKSTDYGSAGDPTRIGLARYRALRDTDAPALVMTPAAATTPARVVAAGRLAVDSVAGEAHTASLVLTLLVPANPDTGAAARRVAFSKASFRIRGAGPRRLSIKLTAAGREALRDLATARVLVARTLVDPSANRTSDRVTLTLQ